MGIRITAHGEADSVSVLVEDERGAFLFDCGALAVNASLPRLDGALISHAHAGSTAGVPSLPENTPIYASVMTAAILLATQEASPPARENETVWTFPGGYGGSRASRHAVQRPFTFLLTQNDSANPPGAPVKPFDEVATWWGGAGAPERLNVSSVTARPPDMLPQFAPNALNGRALRHYPVDHSILGACAIAIETPDGWVGYTGDIRFHGQQPGLMEEFVQGFAELGLAALIVDGTQTQPAVHPLPESEIYEQVLETIRNDTGLIVTDFDIVDMERMLMAQHLAGVTDRLLVLTPRDVHVYEAMRRVWRQFPALDAVDTLRVIDAPDADGLAGGLAAQARSAFPSIVVSPEDIAANGQDYIVRSSPEELEGLGIVPPWRLLNLRRDYPASGHASFEQTVEMIRRIAPRHCIPVHTANPQAFADALSDTAIVVETQRGQPIEIV